MSFENIKLEKGMYQESGYTFNQLLERIDPSSQYIGTPIEGLDAFQRQLKRFDIKVQGPNTDTVEKFFYTSDSAVLFPEYVARAVRHGIEESDILPMITASIVQYGTYEQAKENHPQLTTWSRPFVSSYEVIRFQRLSIFSVLLKEIGAYIAQSRLRGAINTLINGDGNDNSSGKIFLNDTDLNYNAILGFLTRIEPYEMNTLLVSNNISLKLLSIPEIQQLCSNSSFSKSNITLPLFGSEIIRSNAVPDNALIGFDKRFSLQMIQAGDIIVDYDKLIDRQFGDTNISAIGCFSKIYNDTSKVLYL